MRSILKKFLPAGARYWIDEAQASRGAEPGSQGGMTRREVLRSAAAGAVVVAGGIVVAGTPLLSLADETPKSALDVAELGKAIGKLLDTSPYNRVPGTETRVYDAPIFGVSSAEDPLFPKLKEAVAKAHFLPKDWLPGAKSVISYFLPYTQPVSQANRGKDETPELWVQAHHQGAKAAELVRRFIKKTLGDQNVDVFMPFHDARYKCKTLASTWSERHVAFVCGLGTFGLSKNLITAKGSSGRLDSLIVDREIAAVKRAYEGTYDYCTKCLSCVGRCPVGAIREKGKDIGVCAKKVLAGKASPEQAVCGKCLTGVPCESCIPAKAAAPASAPAA